MKGVDSDLQRWRVAPLRPSAQAQMHQLFNEVFKHPMSNDYYHWKYGEGRGESQGVWNLTGQLVAHYGGFVRTVLVQGHPHRVLQIGDVMVARSERGVMTRKGPLFLAASSFFDCHVGSGQSYLFAYGFPNQRHMEIGRKLNLYASTERIYLASWSAENRWSRLQHRARPLLETPDWEGVADRVWQYMAKALRTSVLVRRNAEYLDYRYRQRPETKNAMWVLCRRLTGHPLAIVVVAEQDETLRWMDYVGAPSVIPLAIGFIRYLAFRSGKKKVDAWLTGGMRGAFSAGNPVFDETDVEVAQSNWNLSHGLDKKTADRWWLMYGDTDFL